MREFKITQAEFNQLGPDGLVNKMEEAGFKFLSKTCPIKFSPHFKVEEVDGLIIFKQWEN
jgi:hypothetical protein